MTKKTKMTIEQDFNKRRADIAKRMHIVVVGDEFHIIEIPGGDGEPFAKWTCRCVSMRAAELFRDDLLDDFAYGNLDPCDSRSLYVDYDQQARLLEFLEKRENIADLNELARDLADLRPWEKRPSSSSGDMESDPPF